MQRKEQSKPLKHLVYDVILL